MSLNSKIIKQLNESSSTEMYWDATELDRRSFVALLKFNFGSDSKGNNYIITNDNNEVCRFHADTDEEAIDIFRTKKYVDKDFGSLNESDEYDTYEVKIGFAGFIGVEEDYRVQAKNRVDAVNYALDEPGSEAEQDLSADDVTDNGDGSYTVTVSFAGNIGADKEYEVYADSEEEAEQNAIEEAKSDLEVISVDGEEFSYDEAFESNLNEGSGSNEVVNKIDAYLDYSRTFDEYKMTGSSYLLPFVVWVQQSENIATGFENHERNFYLFIASACEKYLGNVSNAQDIYNGIKHVLEVWEKSEDKMNITNDDLLALL